MVFKLTNPYESERKLSQSVIQVIELLGMYQAELARILGQQCADIGELSSGKRSLQKNTQAWSRAMLFIDIYQQLYDSFEGDGVSMYHWMRTHNAALKGTPHFLLVDDGKLEIIRDYLLLANRDKSTE